MSRLPKRDEVWSCGDATTTMLAVHGNEVARTSTARPDGMVIVDSLDYFLRHFTPPVVPVPSGMPTVLRIHPDHVIDADGDRVSAYVGPGHLPACGNRSGLLRYVLDPERPWEVEPS